jgi:hypothetical protein
MGRAKAFLIHIIPGVVAAEPGLRYALDLPVINPIR